MTHAARMRDTRARRREGYRVVPLEAQCAGGANSDVIARAISVMFGHRDLMVVTMEPSRGLRALCSVFVVTVGCMRGRSRSSHEREVAALQ